MVEYEVKVTYSEDIVTRAANKYWWKTVGSNGFFYLALLAGLFLGYFLLGLPQWFIGFLGALVLVWAGFIIWLYLRIRKFSLVRYREMDDKQATFYFSDFGIRTEADSGKMELAWRLIDKVFQHPEFWLLSVVESTYFTLPLADVPLDVRSFILEHVKSSDDATNNDLASVPGSDT